MASSYDQLKDLTSAIDVRADRHDKKVQSTPVDGPTESPDAPQAPAGDSKVLTDILGVDPETARLLLECAENFEWLKTMSPEDLAKHLNENASDMQMLMLEVARKQDAATDEQQEDIDVTAGNPGF
jgi:hypothetical protein